MAFLGQVEAFFDVPAGETMTCVDGDTASTAVTLTAGSYTIVTFAAHIQTRLVAVMGTGWTCSISVGTTGATGQTFLRYIGSGTYSVTWTTTGTRDILGYTGNLVAVAQGTTSTSTNGVRGLWMPDCPLNCDGSIGEAPTVDDARAVVGPTGASVTLVGTDRYEHTGLVWSHVPIARMWISEETVVNQSYERFYRDAIRGNGNSWFTPGSAMKITNHASIVAGVDGSIVSWKVIGVPKLASVKRSEGKYTGLWRVEWPRLITDA